MIDAVNVEMISTIDQKRNDKIEWKVFECEGHHWVYFKPSALGSHTILHHPDCPCDAKD